MKKIVFILLLMLSFEVFADDKPKLAVMNFTDESNGKLSEDLVKNGSKLIRARFTRYANTFFDIVTDQENEAALKIMKKKSHAIDRDRNFQIELGKQVSASKIVISTIGGLDKDTFLITSTLVDVQRGIDETAADAIFDGTGKGLMDAVDEIVKQLLGDTRRMNYSAQTSISQKSNKQSVAHATESPLEWSSKYIQNKTYNEAVQYCMNLNEGGHKDWRLPTIDEWRTTFQNCPITQPGGKCQVSEARGQLDSSAFSRDCKKGCKKGFSTLIGKGWFWSSSGRQGTNHYWVVSLKAQISSMSDDEIRKGSVYCVR